MSKKKKDFKLEKGKIFFYGYATHLGPMEGCVTKQSFRAHALGQPKFS